MDFEIFVSVEEENSSRTDYTPLKEALRDQSYGLAVTIEECECLCVLCYVFCVLFSKQSYEDVS